MPIRTACEGDIESITKIYAHAVLTGTATFETEPPTAEQMLQRMLDLSGRGYPYLVTEQEGSITGYAYASPYRPRAAYRFTVEDSVYIDPSHQGRGLGRALLGALIEECGMRGYRQMIAVIGGAGNAASIRLHEHYGFQHTGVLRAVGFKFETWVDTVLMQRALP